MTSQDQHGFTLIELIVTTTVLGIIMSTISIALVLYFSSTEETADRLAESPQAQIASVYFTRDAQSGEAANDASRCASNLWANPANTHLVSFGWRDPGDSTDILDDNAAVVSYVVVAGTQKELHRYECTAPLNTPGATFPSTITSGSTYETQTLVSYVDPGTTPTATVTSSKVTLSLAICTADDAGSQCKHGVGLPFDLAVSRRVT